MPPDLSSGTVDALVRVKLEYQPTAVRDADRVQDERLPILESKRLAHVRGANQHEVALGKCVVEKPPAVVEIGNACDDDLVRVGALRYEVALVTLARDTEDRVLVAQTGDRRAGEPPRKPGV